MELHHVPAFHTYDAIPPFIIAAIYTDSSDFHCLARTIFEGNKEVVVTIFERAFFVRERRGQVVTNRSALNYLCQCRSGLLSYMLRLRAQELREQMRLPTFS